VLSAPRVERNDLLNSPTCSAPGGASNANDPELRSTDDSEGADGDGEGDAAEVEEDDDVVVIAPPLPLEGCLDDDADDLGVPTSVGLNNPPGDSSSLSLRRPA